MINLKALFKLNYMYWHTSVSRTNFSFYNLALTSKWSLVEVQNGALQNIFKAVPSSLYASCAGGHLSALLRAACCGEIPGEGGDGGPL